MNGGSDPAVQRPSERQPARAAVLQGAGERGPTREATLLGARIHAVRSERAMTLDALAVSAGLDKGYLSRLERGLKSPSLETLRRIAGALGLKVGELLGEDAGSDAIRITRRADHGVAALLTSSGGLLTARIVRPEAAEVPVEPVGARGGDCLFVALSGSVELCLPDRSIVLDEGDSAHLSRQLPVLVRRVGDPPSILLVAASLLPRRR